MDLDLEDLLIGNVGPSNRHLRLITNNMGFNKNLILILRQFGQSEYTSIKEVKYKWARRLPIHVFLYCGS